MKTLKDWNQIATETNRIWVVKDGSGQPLDWIRERSLSILNGMGFMVVPPPGHSIETMVDDGLLTL